MSKTSLDDLRPPSIERSIEEDQIIESKPSIKINTYKPSSLDLSYTQDFSPEMPTFNNHKIINDYEIAPSNKTLMLLSKEDRTYEEAIYIYKQLKNFEFFKWFKDHNQNLNATEALVCLCKYIQLEKFSPHQYIYKRGDSSNCKVYMLYSGSLNMFYEKSDDEKFHEMQEQKQKSFKRQITRRFQAAYNDSGNHRQQKAAANRMFSPPSSNGEDGSANPTPSMQKAAFSQGNLDFGSMVDMLQSSNTYQERLLSRGSTFGDNILEDVFAQRDMSVMTKSPCDILTISLRDYNFLQTRYEKANTEMLNFLLDHVPDLDKVIREGFTRKVETLFNVVTVDIHNKVIVEGQKGSNFYLLYEGCCELYKKKSAREIKNQQEQQKQQQAKSMTDISSYSRPKLMRGNNQVKSIRDKDLEQNELICLIQPGSFIGEEVIFDKNVKKVYEHTVRVKSSKAKLLAMDLSFFGKNFPYEIYCGLYRLHMRKKENYQQLLISRRETQERVNPQLTKMISSGPKTLNDISRARSINKAQNLAPTPEIATKRPLDIRVSQTQHSSSLPSLQFEHLEKLNHSSINGGGSSNGSNQVKIHLSNEDDYQQNPKGIIVNQNSNKNQQLSQTSSSITFKNYAKKPVQRTIFNADTQEQSRLQSLKSKVLKNFGHQMLLQTTTAQSISSENIKITSKTPTLKPIIYSEDQATHAFGKWEQKSDRNISPSIKETKFFFGRPEEEKRKIATQRVIMKNHRRENSSSSIRKLSESLMSTTSRGSIMRMVAQIQKQQDKDAISSEGKPVIQTLEPSTSAGGESQESFVKKRTIPNIIFKNEDNDSYQAEEEYLGSSKENTPRSLMYRNENKNLKDEQQQTYITGSTSYSNAAALTSKDEYGFIRKVSCCVPQRLEQISVNRSENLSRQVKIPQAKHQSINIVLKEQKRKPLQEKHQHLLTKIVNSSAQSIL